MSEDIVMLDAPSASGPSQEAVATQLSIVCYMMRKGRNPDLMKLLTAKNKNDAVQLLEKERLEINTDIPGAVDLLIEQRVAHRLFSCGPLFKDLQGKSDRSIIKSFKKEFKEDEEYIATVEGDLEPREANILWFYALLTGKQWTGKMTLEEIA